MWSEIKKTIFFYESKLFFFITIKYEIIGETDSKIQSVYIIVWNVLIHLQWG